MSFLPEQIQQVAAFDIGELLPLLVFAALAIAQAIFKMRSKNAPEREQEEDTDAAERARKVREEILRKINERRQANQPDSTRQQQPGGYRYDPTKPESQQDRGWRPIPEPVSRPQPARERPEPARNQTIPSMTHGSSLEDRLKKQREVLERAKREQKAAQEKARRMIHAAGARDEAKNVYSQQVQPSVLRGQVIGGLQSRNGLKKAILYREILGPPVGLR